MRALLCLLAVSAAAYASVIPGAVETNPVRTHPKPSAAAPAAVYQIIVKLRSASAAPASGHEQALSLSAHDRIANVAGRSGVTLREAHEIIDRMHALQVEPASSDDSLETTVERVKADADVEYAVPDERRYAHAIPTDTLYASGQWYEQVNALTPAAVDAQSAWAITTGDSSLVIADLDTGVRFDHPDLLKAANSGRLLPGYDFISNTVVANDGDGRDADASDPGDWITSADKGTSQFKDCDLAISSWHGTRTAGILGALSNNAHGIAGMTWQGKILPVRVLGKCGGYDSDIIAAMMWAAGQSVSGVPTNVNPARIINMSLGSPASCPQSYSDVISQLGAMGVLVVVSAGNEGGPVDAPANCPGAVAVAGLRQAGTKVGFSSLGPQIAVSAPAGNCGSAGSTCAYQIQTTTNSGTQGPTANDDAYTGATIVSETTPKGPNLGTSFSAPIVSGIAALMVSANSNLTTCQLTSRLKEGSVAFPQTSATTSTMCHVPTGTSDMQSLECICTQDGQTCGAGMANAKGAVTAALRPIAAVSLPATVTAGQAVALNASVSEAANGHTISSYQWTSIGKQTVAIQNATSGTATVTAPTCGLATLQIVVTDDAGLTDTAAVVLDSSSVTSIAPTNATNKSCSTPTQTVKLEVCPASTSVQTSATQAFTDTVANTTDDSVTWQVEGVAGGNSTVGTISSTGVYTAPTTPPSGSQVSITAISNADQTVSASATLNVTIPPAAASHSGGGAADPLTLLGEALALSVAVAARRRRA
jgi:serine protease